MGFLSPLSVLMVTSVQSAIDARLDVVEGNEEHSLARSPPDGLQSWFKPKNASTRSRTR